MKCESILSTAPLLVSYLYYHIHSMQLIFSIITVFLTIKKAAQPLLYDHSQFTSCYLQILLHHSATTGTSLSVAEQLHPYQD